MSALLSVAPTVAFTTLPTQCTPYLPLVPTVMPATFINPSPPPPTRCPNLSASVPSAQGLSSASHPSQAPSRAYWRCYVYGISGTRTSTLSPRVPARPPAFPWIAWSLPCLHWAVQRCTPGSGATVGRSPRRSDNPISSPSPHLCFAMLSMSRGCRE